MKQRFSTLSTIREETPIMVMLRYVQDVSWVAGTAEVGIHYQTLKSQAIDAFNVVWCDWSDDVWSTCYELYLEGEGDPLSEHDVVTTDAVVYLVRISRCKYCGHLDK